MKYLTRFIISNQFNLGKNNNTPINFENKKQNVLNLINKKYN